MSTDTIPEFEEHHRLARALEYANIPAPEMAEDLGLARNTIYSYMAGTRRPKLGILKQWAQRCEVSWEWIAQDRLNKPNGSLNNIRFRQVRWPRLRIAPRRGFVLATA